MGTDYLYLIFQAIKNTPLWAWAILVYLLICGIKAMRSRNIHVFKLLLESAIFLILGYITTFGTFNFLNMACLVVGLSAGALAAHQGNYRILINENYVSLKGEYLTLSLLIGLFIVKYIFGYIYAITPETADKYSYLDTNISILISCFFVGRAFYYLYRYIIYKNIKDEN